jgi:hypothetical protein
VDGNLRDYLRDYLLRLLDEKPAAPRARKGRPSNVDRDYWIVKVLARLVAMYNVPLTRSRRPAVRPRPGLSACAIVAQALGGLGIKLNEAGVEAVWSKRRPQLTPREIDSDSPLLSEPDREMIEARVKALMDTESAREKSTLDVHRQSCSLRRTEPSVDGSVCVGVPDGQANAACGMRPRQAANQAEEKGQ